ncbi:MAG: tetratricopeptide repeat protein [Gemmatimonadota bacterium]|nr:MAG: tetratricopeptide repeat protein [Gemmatimonadota bacterium]
MDGIQGFLKELRRRKVYHVAVVYAAIAFALWQIADIAFPALELPDSAMTLVLVLTALGFPIALVLAWAYEVKPDSGAQATREEGADLGKFGPSPEADPDRAIPRSVAVLPFDNMSPEPESEYFSDGITEEITNSLARVRDLKVAARTSAFTFRSSRADVREIGKRLGVAYVVEGSVRRAGDRLRITAQLIDASNGYHLWSERFDRDLGDVFAIQDEVAEHVTRQILAEIPAELESLALPRTEDLDAYDAYLKGRHQRHLFSPDSVERAIAWYTKSVDADPEYAPAYAGLAEAYTIQSIGFATRPSRETMPKAREAADRALELDPRLPDAHLARGLVAMFYEWDYGGAKRCLDRAIELSPSSANAHMWSEFYWTYVEHDYEEALAAIRRAIELDPLEPAYRERLAYVHMIFGRYDEAERLLREQLATGPITPLLHLGLADTLSRKGQLAEAATHVDEALERSGRLITFLAVACGIHALKGDIDKAQELLAELQEHARHTAVPELWLAIAHAGLGDKDEAFACLRRAVENRDSNLLYSVALPRHLGLHDDPRFADILRSIGLSHLIASL